MNDCLLPAPAGQMEWLLAAMEPVIGEESRRLSRHAQIPAQEAYDELRQEWTLCMLQHIRDGTKNFHWSEQNAPFAVLY